MSWYLGVDAGGSYTRAAIVNVETGVVGEGNAGPGNPFSVPPIVAFEAIEQAVAGALGQVGCHAFELAGACIGVAGLARLSPPEGWEEAFSDWRISDLALVSDLEIAHFASFRGAPGIHVIAGTGSSVLVKDAEGESHVYGGWGWLLGDEGSATDIGRSAVQWLTTSADTGAPFEPLAHDILTALNLESIEALVPRIYRDAHPRQVLARLAPLISQRAASGDNTARGLLDDAAKRLGAVVRAASQRLEDAGSHGLSTSGGVFRSEVFRARFTADCAASGLKMVEIGSRLSPLAGAVLRAAFVEERNRAANWDTILLGV